MSGVWGLLAGLACLAISTGVFAFMVMRVLGLA